MATTTSAPITDVQESQTTEEANKTSVPPRDGSKLLNVLLALAIFVTTFFLNSFRSADVIDINHDEATYAIESVAFHRTGVTLWNGQPFYVHPPLFFVLEGIYFKALGIGNSPLFDRLIERPIIIGEPLLPPSTPLTGDDVMGAILAGRYLSVFYSAVIAALIFLLGTRFLNRWAGLLSALLFMLDPYVTRRSHFNMLEPLATLFGVAMIYIYYLSLGQDQLNKRVRYLLGAGALFGLALLSKELALLYFPALILHTILFFRDRIKELVIPLVLGLAVYSIFPIWAAASGEFQLWWDTKTWLFRRITGDLQDTGITRPGTSVARTVNTSLYDYWPSFVLLAAAGLLAALFMFFYFRRGLRDKPSEMLSALIISGYGFFGVVAVIGGVLNEQFFYLIMPAVTLTVGYAVTAWPRLTQRAALSGARKRAIQQEWAGANTGGDGSAPLGMDTAGAGTVASVRNGSATAATLPHPVGYGTGNQYHEPHLPDQYRASRLGRRVQFGLATVTLALVGFTAFAWINRYVFSTDNSFMQVEGFLAKKARPGESIVGRDPLDFYLLPKNTVYAVSFLSDFGNPVVPMDIAERQIPYAILNDKALYERYHGANVPYYDWVRRNGNVDYTFEGRLWDTFVYKLNYDRPIVWDTIGEDSLSANEIAVASSTEDPVRFAPQRAFDTIASSRWSSAETETEWIYVDLGATRTIGRVALAWERAYARSYQIQVSEDAQNWSTVYATNSGQGGYEIAYLSGQGRYVRLLMTKRATRFGYSLWEISVYP
jgi:4-amino-4-deoxy-L-arabinose transferase-like glycosyltransferase